MKKTNTCKAASAGFVIGVLSTLVTGAVVYFKKHPDLIDLAMTSDLSDDNVAFEETFSESYAELNKDI